MELLRVGEIWLEEERPKVLRNLGNWTLVWENRVGGGGGGTGKASVNRPVELE